MEKDHLSTKNRDFLFFRVKYRIQNGYNISPFLFRPHVKSHVSLKKFIKIFNSMASSVAVVFPQRFQESAIRRPRYLSPIQNFKPHVKSHVPLKIYKNKYLIPMAFNISLNYSFSKISLLPPPPLMVRHIGKGDAAPSHRKTW